MKKACMHVWWVEEVEEGGWLRGWLRGGELGG